MFKKHNFLPLIWILVVPTSLAFPLESKEWSYFVFAQQWPPAACLDVPSGKQCSISEKVIDWSIHGLWPTADKGYPSFCNSSWPFKPELIKSILLALEEKWPNIFANTSENSFWKHEWTKHGTCATSLSKFNSELKYFKQSLQLHDQYDIYDLLFRAGIMPNNDRPHLVTYMQNAIESQLNTTVKLFCKNHKQYSSPVLTSMYICMDKKLKLIGCDKITEATCPKTYAFYLPFDRNI